MNYPIILDIIDETEITFSNKEYGKECEYRVIAINKSVVVPEFNVVMAVL